MARGYSGAFGHKLNAPYVFLPLCAIFLLGLVDWRRLWRVANLDLLVLLGFGVSHFFFNRAEIGVSVPLAVPGAALPARRGRCGSGFRGRGEGLRPVWPAAWLLVAALFLMGFRVGLNVADSGAIDVGYAGVVGADRIAHGEPIYDNFPDDVSQGDTYGPVNYLAYVPFERIWPWSGSWDDLPAAHGAAVVFDLATFALLILLGLRIRPGPEGRRLAATLAFGWAAYPYTAYALESNSNDTLVAAAARRDAARPRPAAGPRRARRRSRPGPSSPRRCSAPMLAHLPSARACAHRTACCFARSPSRLRRRVAGDALAGDRPRPAHLLRPHDRLPGRPRLALQHLGPGALLEPLRIAILVATGGALARSSPSSPAARPWSRWPLSAAALLIALQLTAAPLVLPLHRLVLPAVCLVALAAMLEHGERLRLDRSEPEREPAPSPARTSRPAPAR